jgi:hypothetical protein
MPPHLENHPPPRPSAALIDLFQVRPRLPGVPAFPKLRFGFLKGRHAIRRVIGPLTVIDQNQRRLSGPPHPPQQTV